MGGAPLTLQSMRADTFRAGLWALHLQFLSVHLKQGRERKDQGGLLLPPPVSREEQNLGTLEAPEAVLCPLGSAEPIRKAPVSPSTSLGTTLPFRAPHCVHTRTHAHTHTGPSCCPGPRDKTTWHSHLHPVLKVCHRFHGPREHGR